VDDTEITRQQEALRDRQLRHHRRTGQWVDYPPTSASDRNPDNGRKAVDSCFAQLSVGAMVAALVAVLLRRR